MNERHPSGETLWAFVTGGLAAEDALRVEKHLDTCPVCEEQTGEIASSLGPALLDSWREPGYDEAIEHATDGLAEWLAGAFREASNAEHLLADLLREPVRERRRRVWDEERFHSPKLCQLLGERSREAWFSDPAAALEMADLAVTAAERLDPRRHGSSLIEDTRAIAWGYLGNAFRINSDLWRAEQAMRQAWLHHACAGGDVFTETELLSFTCSLRDIQGRTDEALRLSDRVIALYREGQDFNLEGAALIRKGVVLGDQARFGEAILTLREGIARIEPGENPRLLLMGTHNLIAYLPEIGAPGEAAKLLERSRPLYQDWGDPMTIARLRWVEGEIAMRLGRYGEAERALREVRDFYAERTLGVDAMRVSLDLAELYLENKRYQLVKKIAGEVIPLGTSLGLRRQTFLARLLFEKASRG